ncbi:MAG TPA: hypothetical protein VM537_31935 [Anaerolineae bacterium]|nr:hypothetical protein [Anaerolineae bacterium]
MDWHSAWIDTVTMWEAKPEPWAARRVPRGFLAAVEAGGPHFVVPGDTSSGRRGMWFLWKGEGMLDEDDDDYLWGPDGTVEPEEGDDG